MRQTTIKICDHIKEIQQLGMVVTGSEAPSLDRSLMMHQRRVPIAIPLAVKVTR